MNIRNYKKAHFIGIGGVGMSAMAKYLRHQGLQVSGSDKFGSDITEDLNNNYEITFWEGNNPENISSDIDLVVYSPAVSQTDPELQEAQDLGITTQSYPELLGVISRNKKTIAISGTNGKTTTTSMLIEVMKDLGEDPTGIVGAMLQKYNSNFISGQSDYFITEACEYKESFLSIHHDVLVITNITEDHLDYFDNLQHIKKTFIKFLKNKKNSGILICNTQLENLKDLLVVARDTGMKIIDYSPYITDIVLSLPGEHNKQNAAATLAVIEALDLSVTSAKEYLKKYFQGAKRRMEHVGITESGIQIIDDYAHNPEGLEYLISGLRDFYPNKKIIMFFEPHLYSRTQKFKNEFARALEEVDTLYLFPTYKAREKEIPHENYLLDQYINTDKVKLIKVINKSTFSQEFKSEEYSTGHIIISAGAGDVWKYSHALKKTII
jgi:UDP-N-acetylmuramate--alanine ligase